MTIDEDAAFILATAEDRKIVALALAPFLGLCKEKHRFHTAPAKQTPAEAQESKRRAEKWARRAARARELLDALLEADAPPTGAEVRDALRDHMAKHREFIPHYESERH